MVRGFSFPNFLFLLVFLFSFFFFLFARFCGKHKRGSEQGTQGMGE